MEILLDGVLNIALDKTSNIKLYGAKNIQRSKDLLSNE